MFRKYQNFFEPHFYTFLIIIRYSQEFILVAQHYDY